jgi:hypothetical protein
MVDIVKEVSNIISAKGDLDFIKHEDCSSMNRATIMQFKNLGGVEVNWTGHPYHNIYVYGHKPYENRLVIGTLLDKTNEWFFPKWVEYHKRFTDKIIVLADIEKGDLEKETYDLCENNGIIIKPFGFPWNESKCWSKLLYECMDFWPEWFWFSSSDEVYSEKFAEDLPKLLDHPYNCWYGFGVLHYWKDDYFRTDSMWGAGRNVNCIKLFRNVVSVHAFSEREWHGPSVSPVYNMFPGERLEYKIKHYGHMGGKWKEKCELRGKDYSTYDEELEKKIVLENVWRPEWL